MSRRFTLRILSIVVLMLVLFSGAVFAQGRSQQAFERVRQVQARHTNRLMNMKDVEGTAIGVDDSGRLTFQVFTAGPRVSGIPGRVEGVPVQVVAAGKFYAMAPKRNPGQSGKQPPKTKIDPTSKFPLPVPIGISTGNEGECSAGTIGCRLKGTIIINNQATSAVFALSNNHVYALENDAEDFSWVLQPGRYDTRCSTATNNKIGYLYDYMPIDFSGTNYVDAAIALCSTETLGNSTPVGTGGGYGIPNSAIKPAALKMSVKKYGRTTSLTTGTITSLNWTGNVGYGSGTAYFTGQILVYNRRSAVIKAGDSGSLLVTNDSSANPVGLLFAGDSTGKYAIANPIDDVLEAFGAYDVTIDGK